MYGPKPNNNLNRYSNKKSLLQKESPSKVLIDQLNKWSSGFEEVDPLLKFEQMNLEEVSLRAKFVSPASFPKPWVLQNKKYCGIISNNKEHYVISGFYYKTTCKKQTNIQLSHS